MAGTLTVTVNSTIGGGFAKYVLAWTSTAGGAVSANLFTVKRGHLSNCKIVPSSAGTQPTDSYDITLVDEDGVDVMDARGANLSNAAGKYVQWDPPFFLDGTQQLDLVVSNAGNAKGGTVTLWIF